MGMRQAMAGPGEHHQPDPVPVPVPVGTEFSRMAPLHQNLPVGFGRVQHPHLSLGLFRLVLEGEGFLICMATAAGAGCPGSASALVELLQVIPAPNHTGLSSG